VLVARTLESLRESHGAVNPQTNEAPPN